MGRRQGVEIASDSADRVSGVIRGTMAPDDVAVRAFTQSDGRVRLEFSVSGAKGTDAVPADRLSSAYDRRIGR